MCIRWYYAYLKRTSVCMKRFYPNCGNNTLKKVIVSLKTDGQQVIHINTRINTRRAFTARYTNRPVTAGCGLAVGRAARESQPGNPNQWMNTNMITVREVDEKLNKISFQTEKNMSF